MLDFDDKRNTDFHFPIWGYLLSATLVFAAYYLASKGNLVSWALIFIIAGIAIVQSCIQLFLFLHIGIESKPRWGIMTTLFTVLVIVIVFGGTLWIMRNLSYNLMPAH